MEKCILHVELVHRPMMGGGKVQDRSNGGGLDDGGEGLVEVDPQSLLEPTDHRARLAVFERAIGMYLALEYPFPSDHVDAWRTRD